MAKTETTVNNLKINRGTYANIQANLSSISENELIITTDKNMPVPTASDAGKVISVDSNGEYTLQPTSPSGVTSVGIINGGGLTVSGSPITSSGSITVGHATGTGTSTSNTGRTYVQNITLDSYGHITNVTNATETVVDTNTTYSLNVNGTGTNATKLGLTAGGSGSGTTWVTVPYATTAGSADSVAWANVVGHDAGVDADLGIDTSSGDTTKFLNNKGDWAVPPDTNTTYTFADGTNGFTVTPSGGQSQTVVVTPSIANNITGSGTSGSIAKFSGTNTITGGPAFDTSDTTKHLRHDGNWVDTAYRTSSIPYGQVDATSTSTAYTATVPGITELRDGVCVWLKNGVVTSEAGFTINVNNLGAKPSYSNMAAATADTTIFNVNYTMLFVYDSTRVSGGCWVCYRGYDSNSNTIGYQLRTNSMSMAVSGATYRYRILFTSADGTKYVPANTSTSTNATSARAVNQTPIDPFGDIRYYSSTTAVSSGSRPGTSSLWQQYTLTLGYSFNRTGAALTLTSWKPVYVKCAPQANGSAIMDADTPFVQALPSTEDGKIYIFLGVAYSATAIELLAEHPVYCYKNNGIRHWTGQDIATPTSVSTAITTAIEALDVTNITSGLSASKTITALSETDGLISATASDIAIGSGQVTKDATNVTIATSDVLPVFDNSDSNKLKGSIAFDTSNTTDFLRKDGTWVTPVTVSVGTLNTNNSTAQTVPTTAESFGGNISLHKIAKTGTYSDLIGRPTIPAAPGTLNTTATTAQTTSASEALSGSVTLHKVSKTGDYGDLLNKPTDANGIVPIANGGTGVSDASGGTWYTSTELHPRFHVYFNSDQATFYCVYEGPYTGISSVSTALSSDYVKMALSSEVPVTVTGSGIVLFNGTIMTNALGGSPEFIYVLFPDTVTFGGSLVNGLCGTLTYSVGEGLYLSNMVANQPYWYTTWRPSLFFDGLDGEGQLGPSRTLDTLYQSNGVIYASATDIAITSDKVTKYSTDATIATGDKIGIFDSSDSNKLKSTSISFDTTNTTDFLRRDGTWAVPSGGAGTITDVQVNNTSVVTNGVANIDTTGLFPKTGGEITGDVTLLKEGTTPGDSYSLIFQRGTLTDSYNDWRLQDRGGYLYFDQRGANSTTWSNQVMFNTSGGITATSFSGSGASLTSLNASNISSGTLNAARLPSGLEYTTNKVTSISSSSTDDQYASAKCTYDAIDAKESKGKITISGTEYTVSRQPLTITDGNTTTTYYVAVLTT